ncbi:MAG TPA: hypothetical protein VHL53_11055, partial [Acidimicrobiia bacterium]|nr:hypothetical protein [Acidimicrobiia bacterium]
MNGRPMGPPSPAEAAGSPRAGGTPGGSLDRLAGFTAHLREAGLDATPARTLTFCRSVATLGAEPAALYWAGRLAFVGGPAEFAAYDRAFVAWAGGAAPPVPELEFYEPPAHHEQAGATAPDAPAPGGPPSGGPPSGDGVEPGSAVADFALGDEDDAGAGPAASVAGTAETLRRRDFEHLSPAERNAVAEFIRDMTLALPV